MQVQDKQWQQLVLISHTMLAQAQQKNWQELTRLDVQRKQLLEQYFANTATLDDTAKIIIMKEHINTLETLNQKIIACVKEEKSGLSEEKKNVQKGRNANKAYQRFSR